MPRGDRTGPAGSGPRTGRMRGFCRGVDAPGTPNRTGDSVADIRAGRRGWLNRSFTTGRMAQPGAEDITPDRGSVELTASAPEQESELATLKAQARCLEQALEGINRRLQELESKAEQE